MLVSGRKDCKDKSVKANKMYETAPGPQIYLEQARGLSVDLWSRAGIVWLGQKLAQVAQKQCSLCRTE